MFLALVIMLPLFCLTLAAAVEGLLTRPLTIDEVGRSLRNLALAGALLSLLPPATETGQALRPLFELSLMLALAGTIVVRSGQSPFPKIWLYLSAVGSMATLSVWMLSPI